MKYISDIFLTAVIVLLIKSFVIQQSHIVRLREGWGISVRLSFYYRFVVQKVYFHLWCGWTCLSGHKTVAWSCRRCVHCQKCLLSANIAISGDKILYPNINLAIQLQIHPDWKNVIHKDKNFFVCRLLDMKYLSFRHILLKTINNELVKAKMWSKLNHQKYTLC